MEVVVETPRVRVWGRVGTKAIVFCLLEIERGRLDRAQGGVEIWAIELRGDEHDGDWEILNGYSMKRQVSYRYFTETAVLYWTSKIQNFTNENADTLIIQVVTLEWSPRQQTSLTIVIGLLSSKKNLDSKYVLPFVEVPP